MVSLSSRDPLDDALQDAREAIERLRATLASLRPASSTFPTEPGPSA